MKPNRRQRGFTLIELMVSLLIGLIVVGIAVNLLLSNLQTFKVNEGLGRIQEGARGTFETLARDLREAGQTSCGTGAKMANVIRTGGAIPAWSDWMAGSARGYAGDEASSDWVDFGTEAGDRVDGTPAVVVMQAGSLETRISAHVAATGTFTVNSTTGFSVGQPVVACDGRSSAVFVISSLVGTTGVQLSASGANCSLNLAYPGAPTPATCGSFSAKTFQAGGFLAELSSALWYVGYNEQGGKSLFRMVASTSGGAVSLNREELVNDVGELALDYLTADFSVSPPTLATEWVAADEVTNWSDAESTRVVAVRADLSLQSADPVGTNAQPLSRRLISVVSLHNREAR